MGTIGRARYDFFDKPDPRATPRTVELVSRELVYEKIVQCGSFYSRIINDFFEKIKWPKSRKWAKRRRRKILRSHATELLELFFLLGSTAQARREDRLLRTNRLLLENSTYGRPR